jgi:hypothetical protein
MQLKLLVEKQINVKLQQCRKNVQGVIYVLAMTTNTEQNVIFVINIYVMCIQFVKLTLFVYTVKMWNKCYFFIILCIVQLSHCQI